MARIAGVNIPQNKVVHVALTYIHGIGKKFSNDICTKLSISKNKRVNSLTEEEVLKIREFIDGNYKVDIIDSYQNKNYSDRVNINKERILIIKDNDTILDIESD